MLQVGVIEPAGECDQLGVIEVELAAGYCLKRSNSASVIVALLRMH